MLKFWQSKLFLSSCFVLFVCLFVCWVVCLFFFLFVFLFFCLFFFLLCTVQFTNLLVYLKFIFIVFFFSYFLFFSFSCLQEIDSLIFEQIKISMNRNRRQGSSIPSLLDMPGSGSGSGGTGSSSFGSSYGNNYSSSTGYGLSSGRWHLGVLF